MESKISLQGFVAPVTVTPGEYLVYCHDHYTKTTRNERWHQDYDRDEFPSNSLYLEDMDYSSDSSSSASSRSPSPPPSIAWSYREETRPIVPSPRKQSSKSPVAPRKPVSAPRKTYRRVVAKEAKLALKKTAAGKVAEAKTRQEKAKGKEVLRPVRSLQCLWAGCTEHIEDGKALWTHIETVHKPLGDTAEEEPEMLEEPDDEEEMDLDAPPISVCRADRALDSDDMDEEEVDELLDDDDDDGEYGAGHSAPGHKHKKRAPHVDKYQTKIRCMWQRCKTTIQFAGLRRHIESKHSRLRNTSCPKGCGYETNRPDMMPRHTLKCHYRAPKRDRNE